MGSLLGGGSQSSTSSISNTGQNINNNTVSSSQPITPYFTLTNINQLPATSADSTAVPGTFSSGAVNFSTPSLSGSLPSLSGILNPTYIIVAILIILIILYFTLR